jgi:hypothetical protein
MEERALQALLDRQAITDVLTRYCAGVDRLDAELIAGCYHADGRDDHGVFEGLGSEFAVHVVEVLRRHAAATHHQIGQVDIVFGDGTPPVVARAESYVLAFHRLDGQDGTELESFGGRYVDRFERRDGVWRIADRRVLPHWNARGPIKEFFPRDAFDFGARDRTDPRYGPP